MEQTKELYTIGLHYYDIVAGLKKDAIPSAALSNQRLQITKKAVGEKELALSIQHFYMRLLRRYLIAKHGNQHSEPLLRKYNDSLLQLRKMREIFLEKSLQF